MAAQQSLRSLTKRTYGLTSSNSVRPYICQPCILQREQQQRLHFQRQTRQLHKTASRKPVPAPTPFVPDVTTFLTLIGRGLSTHASKFTSWDSLFKLTSDEIKELGVEPARSRKYLLRWREKFRKGDYGIGGDFKHVTDGVGEVRMMEIPALPRTTSSASLAAATPNALAASTSQTPGMVKLVLNTPKETKSWLELLRPGETANDLKKAAFMKLKDGYVVIGSHLRPVKGTKGSVATLTVAEGLWEDRRGRKIFGGERRRAETLHKMRIEEKKNAK